MFRVLQSTRLVAVLVAILLFAGACSSSTDSTTAASDESSADTGSTDVAESDTSSDDESSSDDDSASFALTCDEVIEPSNVIRGSHGWLQQISEENVADLAPDYDRTLAAIEALRPIQDIDGVLGTMREGLDNMEADLVAAREGRFDDMVGGYSVASMNAVIGQEICS